MKITQANSCYQHNTSKQKKVKTMSNKVSFEETVKTTSKSNKVSNSNEVWRKIGEKYDLTNCTYGDYRDAIEELREAQVISGEEYLATGIDVRSLSDRLDNDVYPVMFSRNDCKGNVNWIREFEVRLAKGIGKGDYEVNATEITLNILKRLSASRNNQK